MAAAYNVRSNSFPARQNPQAAQVDDQLSRLQSSEGASTSSSSVGQQLKCLQDLHDSLDKLVQLHLNQQALAQDQNKKFVAELLDGSLRILDVCSIAKDALSQTKESLSEIHSCLRRKRGDLSKEIKQYLASRKSLSKSFQKALKSLKATENKSNNDGSLAVFGEAEAVTVSVFGSLMCFISGSKLQTKPCSKWALVSKLMNQKKVTCEEKAAEANEFARIDAAFHLFADKKSEKSLNIEDVENLEMCIQDLEEGLESLFRSLIKVRVSVLNIVGQ